MPRCGNAQNVHVEIFLVLGRCLVLRLGRNTRTPQRCRAVQATRAHRISRRRALRPESPRTDRRRARSLSDLHPWSCSGENKARACMIDVSDRVSTCQIISKAKEERRSTTCRTVSPRMTCDEQTGETWEFRKKNECHNHMKPKVTDAGELQACPTVSLPHSQNRKKYRSLFRDSSLLRNTESSVSFIHEHTLVLLSVGHDRWGTISMVEDFCLSQKTTLSTFSDFFSLGSTVTAGTGQNWSKLTSSETKQRRPIDTPPKLSHTKATSTHVLSTTSSLPSRLWRRHFFSESLFQHELWTP